MRTLEPACKPQVAVVHVTALSTSVYMSLSPYLRKTAALECEHRYLVVPDVRGLYEEPIAAHCLAEIKVCRHSDLDVAGHTSSTAVYSTARSTAQSQSATHGGRVCVRADFAQTIKVDSELHRTISRSSRPLSVPHLFLVASQWRVASPTMLSSLANNSASSRPYSRVLVLWLTARITTAAYK